MITAITGTDGIGKKVEALWIDIKAALPAA